MELDSVNPTEMELAHTSSSSSSTRSSTPVMSNCERLQIANSEIRKFAILHANVSHAIEAAAPYAQDDDSDLADMYSRQHYLDQRRQKATDFSECGNPEVHLSGKGLETSLESIRRFGTVDENDPYVVKTRTELQDYNSLLNLAPKKGTNDPNSKNTYSNVVNSIVRPNISYANALKGNVINSNSHSSQQMATGNSGNPAGSSQTQANSITISPQIPLIPNSSNNPANLITIITRNHTSPTASPCKLMP
ncbi:hypothetical protein TNIN_140581 [Trichonephila inaurata madagascariensis]|uniref:Uncharacterized protein n=1 Tax=Trichonephila inaurata madagascariensis TaxID=2747483 RepID=A0A8X6Y4Q9_9ARAC|nr:hypothetical protein TNIN_140581 [Trichonephila inaurata madagascariensis]